jgi:hypothetical protein
MRLIHVALAFYGCACAVDIGALKRPDGGGGVGGGIGGHAATSGGDGGAGPAQTSTGTMVSTCPSDGCPTGSECDAGACVIDAQASCSDAPAVVGAATFTGDTCDGVELDVCGGGTTLVFQTSISPAGGGRYRVEAEPGDVLVLDGVCLSSSECDVAEVFDQHHFGVRTRPCGPVTVTVTPL